jgi:fructosamine-3-kinase
MQISVAVQNRLCDAFSAAISQVNCIAGGDTSETFYVRFANRKQVFVKLMRFGCRSMFTAEVQGLALLTEKTSFVIPEVLFQGETEDACILVLEHLRILKKDDAFFVGLAHCLAEMHSVSAELFGLTGDNFIGASYQWNTQDTEWGRFFFEQRLERQVELGCQNGWLTQEDQEDFLLCKKAVISYLNQSRDAAVLLHGDFWSGNVLHTEAGPALIDPAVYFGNREADIAFSEFFGGFSSTFYDSYQRLLPLSNGYTERKGLLNLYHLLNHANLFAGDYCRSAKQELDALTRF